jgi:hypothetical protein
MKASFGKPMLPVAAAPFARVAGGIVDNSHRRIYGEYCFLSLLPVYSF